MDPRGGVNPSSPRLDGVRPQPSQPSQTAQPAVPDQLATPNPAVAAPTLENPVPSQALFETPESSDSLVDAPVPTKKSGGKGRTIALILVGVLVLVGLSTGAYFLGFTMGKSKGRQLADADYQKQQAEAQKLAAEEEEQAESTESGQDLDLKNLIEPKYVDETLEGEVGKQIQASDGLVLKVVNIERSFQSEDPNYKLDTSKELVKVNFLIGNTDKSKSKDISSFSFRLENAAAAQLTPENVTGYEGKFDTVKLDPGGQAKGSIVYAVNKSEKPLKFIREQRYRISSENREVTTRIVITVAK